MDQRDDNGARSSPATITVVELDDEPADDRLDATDVQRAALLASVSHEFRTPLTVIGAACKVIADGSLHGDAAGRLAESVLSQVQRLERLVNGVLAASGADEDQLEEVVPVSDLAQWVVDRLRTEERDRVVLDLPVDEVVVSIRTRLGSALSLLVEQAVRQAPSGEDVTVQLRRDPEGVSFTINDGDPAPTGPTDRGFAARLELDHGIVGTGLGLFTTEQIARRLGGELRVTDGPPPMQARLYVPQRRDTDQPGHQSARATPWE